MKGHKAFFFVCAVTRLRAGPPRCHESCTCFLLPRPASHAIQLCPICPILSIRSSMHTLNGRGMRVSISLGLFLSVGWC